MASADGGAGNSAPGDADPPPLRALFGGAAEARVPARFTDLSDIREVPDNQEVLADLSRDESVVVELLELKGDVPDASSAEWFFRDLGEESEATSTNLLQTSVLPPVALPLFDASVFASTAVGQMVVAKAREGPSAGNLVRCYVANIRLRAASTDVLVTVYEPLVVSGDSSAAAVVGPGAVSGTPAHDRLPAGRVFDLFLASFKINDWGLFGH